MCLPVKNDQSESSAPGPRSIVGLGALMLVACLAGPALAGAIAALGVGVLVGAGGAMLAIALCVAVPAIAAATRRRGAPRQPTASSRAGHGA